MDEYFDPYENRSQARSPKKLPPGFGEIGGASAKKQAEAMAEEEKKKSVDKLQSQIKADM